MEEEEEGEEEPSRSRPESWRGLGLSVVGAAMVGGTGQIPNPVFLNDYSHLEPTLPAFREEKSQKREGIRTVKASTGRGRSPVGPMRGARHLRDTSAIRAVLRWLASADPILSPTHFQKKTLCLTRVTSKVNQI